MTGVSEACLRSAYPPRGGGACVANLERESGTPSFSGRPRENLQIAIGCYVTLLRSLRSLAAIPFCCFLFAALREISSVFVSLVIFVYCEMFAPLEETA
jgi:hypothetical protein